MKLIEALTSRESFTTTLLTILIDKYGTECLEWDPLALAVAVDEDFHVSIPKYINDRIQTGCALLTTNMFFQNLESYIMMCDTMAFNLVEQSSFIPADVDDCAWGVTEAMLLLGSDFKENKFAPDIALYTGTILAYEGLWIPPSILSFATYPDKPEKDIPDVEDEVMFQAAWSAQEARRQEIEVSVREQMTLMFNQLKELPIEINRNVLVTE